MAMAVLGVIRQSYVVIMETISTFTLPCKVKVAVWSNKRDLLCLVSPNNDIVLLRMEGDVVWKLSLGQTVKDVVWRSDGSYNNV